jgi:bifunctional enzyme CysN/CysC
MRLSQTTAQHDALYRTKREPVESDRLRRAVAPRRWRRPPIPAGASATETDNDDELMTSTTPRSELPAPADARDVNPLYLAVVGQVDHGKSTLVGRLLHETGSLPEGKVEQVQAMCRRRGVPFEWAFVTDALKAECDQGVTIDASHIRLRTPKRSYVLVDAPGHLAFLHNMISGAAGAEAALLVIDAAEGVKEQSRRHGYLLHLLGIRQLIVAVNKMDLVGYDAARFHAIEAEFRDYLGSLGLRAEHFIPVSARGGDGVAEITAPLAWYSGPTLAEALDDLHRPPQPRQFALRMPVQDVYKLDGRRIIAGRIECGVLNAGDEILVSPSNKTARVRSIEIWNATAPVDAAHAGQSVEITLEDPIPVERGEVISHLDAPPMETTVFRARLFWLGNRPLKRGDRYQLRLGTANVPVRVQSVEKVISTADLSSKAAAEVPHDGVADVVLQSRSMLALDPFERNPRLGRFALIDGYDTVGGGVISMEGYPDQRGAVTVKATNISEVAHRISHEMRVAQNGHAPGVLWLTGLSGAGKSTLAIELEQRLFRKGYQVFVLDGDNVRHGLNANLGFSPEDRAENIRRVGEVAALFAEAGLLVITAFISPYRADRDRARAAAGDNFHEIHVAADLATCESRDPKGLYRRARAGEIRDFTGISAPYEPPAEPELTVDTSALDVEAAVQRLVDYVEAKFALKRR